MKSINFLWIIGFAVLLAASCELLNNKSGTPINENIWINGFLASWHHNPQTEMINSGFITTEEIDWDALTHLTYFAFSITPEGEALQSLDPQVRDNFNSDRLESIVAAAHNHSTDILFSVGGAGTYEAFQSAIGQSHRMTLIQTLSDIITDYGFDGVNINMIPIETADFANYTEFVSLLGATLDTVRTTRGRRPLMTANVLKSEQTLALFGQIHHHFEQIHILTYDLSQPWRSSLVWHGSALYNERHMLDSPFRPLPSVDEFVRLAIASGIPRSKLGIAINFNGAVWEGVNLRGKWPSWPDEAMSIMRRISYQELKNLYPIGEYEWDGHAQVPYLNLEDPRLFISFENARSIERKVAYAEQERLGGVMIWEIGGGFLDGESSGNRNPLLRAVKESTFQFRNQ